MSAKIKGIEVSKMVYKAFCPSCKYDVYSYQVWGSKKKYRFVCTCGCVFTLDIKFAKKA